MLTHMLDTDIAIYTIKRKPSAVLKAFNEHDGQLCVSTVTAMELLYGVEKSSRRQHNLKQVEGFLARLSVLEFDMAAASHAGEIRSSLDAKGTPIGPYDALIAGHARSRGFTLVSNNLREFVRVDGLRVVNWLTKE